MDKKEEEKKEKLLTALDKGMVMIHLDARRPGVIVPHYLRTEAHLRLNLSYRFDPPDVSIGEWGLRSTLSFSGSRFTVAVPWSALFAITSYITREFWIYPDDMPRELIDATMAPERVDGVPGEMHAMASENQQQQAPVEQMKPSRSHLREIICEKSDEPAGNAPVATDAPAVVEAARDEVDDEGGPKDEPPKPPARGHLRIVK